MPSPFIIFALPRSRTAWMAHYLSYASPVGHDILIECDRQEDFLQSFANGMAGTVETGGILGARLIKKALPKIKFVVVKRPLAEVRQSLEALGLTWSPSELEEREALLQELSATAGVETIDFKSLSIPQCAKWLFEHCLEREWDVEWFNHWEPINVQVIMQQRIAQLARRAEANSAFISSVRESLSHALH